MHQSNDGRRILTFLAFFVSRHNKYVTRTPSDREKFEFCENSISRFPDVEARLRYATIRDIYGAELRGVYCISVLPFG